MPLWGLKSPFFKTLIRIVSGARCLLNTFTKFCAKCFSPYVWEDKALEFLNQNPEIKRQFDSIKSKNESFANNWYTQLDWIHKHSPNYENAHLQYPIYRILK